jgi:hypothetical protein
LGILKNVFSSVIILNIFQRAQYPIYIWNIPTCEYTNGDTGMMEDYEMQLSPIQQRLYHTGSKVCNVNPGV